MILTMTHMLRANHMTAEQERHRGVHAQQHEEGAGDERELRGGPPEARPHAAHGARPESPHLALVLIAVGSHSKAPQISRPSRQEYKWTSHQQVWS